MNNYRIVIPSYQRADILKNKTLKLLEHYKIKPNQIDIILGTKEEVKQYKTVLDKKYHKRIITHGQKGIGAVRNWIKWYYKYQTKVKYLISIDDDIDKLMDYDKPLADLHKFIKLMFFETDKRKLNLWGVSPFHNTFFLKSTISHNLKYICGAFNGEIIDRKKHDIYTEYDHLEDFGFTCEHFLRDGGVVRHNGVAIVTKYFADGGINESYGGLDNRKLDMEIACLHFKDKYEDMCRIKIKDYGYDIRLNGFFKDTNTI